MKRYSLDGTWRLRGSDGQRSVYQPFIFDGKGGGARGEHLPGRLREPYNPAMWIDATVPGSVHLDLQHAGLLEDPYIGAHILHTRWVEETVWYYRQVFDAEEAAQAPMARLYFQGLDYGAVIYLNGERIGWHANAFRPCTVDVTGRLKPKDNELLLCMESGLFSAGEKPISGFFIATDTVEKQLLKRIWLRKIQSSAGWDWSPRLMNVGIYGHVWLDYSDTLLVSQTAVRMKTSADLQTGQVQARVFLDRPCPCDTILEMTIDGHTMQFPHASGTECLTGAMEIAQPRLWWPVGHGTQERYTLYVRICTPDGREVYATKRRIGFRHVEMDQTRLESGGRVCILKINGRPIFAKGGNLVPADMITAAAGRARYEALIAKALEANFNLMRVWGGGQYETDDFYELCDEKGILVWQEFICACSALPYYDEAFAREVRDEFRYQTRRLSEHPSLVVWCGNNESEMGTVVQTEGVLFPDYALYYRVLPDILREEDGEKYYQPTSPYCPDHSPEYWNFEAGDQHPWDVGFAEKDYRLYRRMTCRFANEGGMLGPTSLKTMRACLAPGQEQRQSFSWLLHDNTLSSMGEDYSSEAIVRFWYGLEAKELSLEEAVYAGGLAQGEALAEYAKNFRRRKFLSAAAVFWMFNDCWPCTSSWSIVDYYLRRTPSYFHVRRAFAPVTVVVTEEEGDWCVYGVNDCPADFHGILRWGVFTCAGTYLLDEQREVVVEDNASCVLARWKADPDRYGTDAIPFAMLQDTHGTLVARDRLLRQTYASLPLCDEALQVKRQGTTLSFESAVFVMGVCLDLEGERTLSDNLFDVYPGMTYTVTTESAMPEPAVITTLNRFLKNSRK